MKSLFIFLFLFVTIYLFAEDTLTILYKIQYEYSNYSFKMARNYKTQINTTDKFALINKNLIECELLLYERNEIPRENLIVLEKSIKKLIKKDKRKYLLNYFHFMLNDLQVLSMIDTFYTDKHKLNIDLKNEVLNVYNNQIGKAIVSFNIVPIYSYLLYSYDFKEESLEVLNDLYLDTGLEENERKYLYYINLTMYNFIDNMYDKALEAIDEIKNLDVIPNYHQYIKAMPYLWLSLISYKQNDAAESLSSFEIFIDMKDEIDKSRSFVVPLKDLLSPMPGVFPPNHIYEDFSKIYDLYLEKKTK